MPQNTAMTYDRMMAVLNETRPGDRLRIVVADVPVDQYRIKMLLYVCHPMMGGTPYLDIGDDGALTLSAVHDSGTWFDCRSYEATVLEGFDADDFAYRTLRNGMLESIEKY